MKQVKHRFVLLIWSIVIATFAATCIYLFSRSLRELERSNTAALVDRVTTVADDLQRQFAELQVTSIMIQNNRIYNRTHLRENIYNEVELLKDFPRYKSASQITEDYFLIYNDSVDVFKSTGGKNSLSVFLKYYGIQNDLSEIYNELIAADSYRTLTIRTISGEKKLLVFPIYASWSGSLTTQAVLAFFVSPESIGSRINALTGGFDGQVYIYMNSEPFIAPDGGEFPNLADESVVTKHDDITRIRVSSGIFTVICDTPSDEMYNGIRSFVATNSLNLVLVLCAMLTLAVFVGLYGYKPIGSLVKKYADADTSSDELLAISTIIENALRSKTEAERTLQSSYEIIKHRTLRLILNGDNDLASLGERQFFGISLPGPFYTLFILQGSIPLPQDTQKQLSTIDEAMPGVYFSDTKYPNCYAFLVSLEEKQKIDDVTEQISELCNEIDDYTLTQSDIFDDLSLFSECLNSAAMQGDPRVISPADFTVDGENADVSQIIAAVSVKNGHAAEFYLSEFLKKLHASNGSFYYEKYVTDNLINILCHTANGDAVSVTQINKVLSAASWKELSAELTRMVWLLCGSEREEHTQIYSHGKEILEYIRNNISDSEMTLETLSGQFSLSKKYISTIIKDETGLSYKDYLTNLRIAEARRLLKTENVTVTEVCRRCGYIHLPYFIKIFKRETGMTPAAFRNDKESSGERENLT